MILQRLQKAGIWEVKFYVQSTDVQTGQREREQKIVLAALENPGFTRPLRGAAGVIYDADSRRAKWCLNARKFIVDLFHFKAILE